MARKSNSINFRNNTNLNQFLKDYGIRFRGDNVVRTSYYKYPHPKECFIETCKVHPEFLKSIKSLAGRKKIVLNDDLLDNDDDIVEEDSNLKIVYPYGQSLDVNPNVSVVFNSGILSYPINRPLSACRENKKGRLFVLGSEKFFEDDYFEKEENKKVTVRHIKTGWNDKMVTWYK